MSLPVRLVSLVVWTVFLASCRHTNQQAKVAADDHGKKILAACGSHLYAAPTDDLSDDLKTKWAAALHDSSVTDYTQYEQMRQIVLKQTKHDILEESLTEAAASAAATPESSLVDTPAQAKSIGDVDLDPCYSDPVIPTLATAAPDDHSYGDDQTAGHFRVAHSGALTNGEHGGSNYKADYKGFFFGHQVELGNSNLVVTPPHIDGGAGGAAQAGIQAAFFGIDAIVNKQFDVSNSVEVQHEAVLLGLLVNMTYIDLDFELVALANIGAKAEIITKFDKKPLEWTMSIRPIFLVTALLRGEVTPTFAPRFVAGGLVGELTLIDVGESGLYAQGIGSDIHTWAEVNVNTLAGDLAAEVYFSFWRAHWRMTYKIVKWDGFSFVKTLGSKPGVQAGSATQ